MKPFCKSPSFYLTLLATLLSAIAGMEGLPGSVTQICGVLGSIIAPMALTVQRTVLAHQDSKEEHELRMAESIVAPLPPVSP